ncbi:MAG TPA: carboxypeptidase-like regulatory domain-containing protein [Solirubrobacterales bacterium]|nr:carboxypeptidase-like regulatory domain-containing protein [Solirubrobacterales bacterium]
MRVGRFGLGAVVFLLFALGTGGSAYAAGSISGTVTAEGGGPLAGVRVCALFYDEIEAEHSFCALSGGDGGYEIGSLPPETYAVEFLAGAEGLNYVYEAWDDQPLPFLADRVDVADAPVTGIDAELTEGGELSGKVVDATDGRPVPGVRVCAEPGIEHEIGCATTNLAGDYTVAGLSSDNYLVEFSPPEELEYLLQYWDEEPGILEADEVGVTAGEVTSGVDAHLRRSGAITGTIIDAVTRAPMEGVGACTFDIGGPEYIGECGESDAAGRYTIRRVPPGTYHVRYFTPGGYSALWYRCANGSESAMPVTVTPWGSTGEIDAALVRSGPAGEFSQCLAALEPPAPPVGPAPLQQPCRKGYKRKRVNGKVRCVRVRARGARWHGLAIAGAIAAR